MDRRDYYFRQKVTEAELDGGFDDVEAALWNVSVDHGLRGIVLGMTAAQNGVPNLTINVSGPGVAYDSLGRRIAIPSTQNVNVGVDENGVSTAVAGVGNQKYVSVFIEFDRTLSDPRIDGNSLGLFFLQEESFRFVVRQGAEAAAGVATPPALDGNMILVCDILRSQGVTTILNGAIQTGRREDFIRFEGLTLEIVAGTAREGVGLLLQHLIDHVDGTATRHPAAAIDYAGSSTWAGAISGIPSGTVEAALDAVVTQLGSVANPCGGERIGTRATVGTYATGSGYAASSVWGLLNAIVTDLGTTGATSGAHRVGSAARTAWLGGRTNPATSVFAAIDKIITDLAAQTASDDGAERIGAQAFGNLAAGSVRSQLNELDTEKGGLDLDQTWNGENYFANIVEFSSQVDFLLGANFGAGMLNTPTDNDTRRLYAAIAPVTTIGVEGRTLMFEFGNLTAGRLPVRVYGSQHEEGRFEIAINCLWNNLAGTWSKDVSGDPAFLYSFGVGGFGIQQRNSASAGAWSDIGWNSVQFAVGQNSSSPSMVAAEGILRMSPVALTGVSNPSSGSATLGNALYAMNIVDAWIKGLNNTSKDDGFGSTAANVATGSGTTVTFDRSVGGTFQQAVVVSGNTGTTATTAGYMTAVLSTVNTCVVRRWAWNGTAIAETTLGDWSLIRMARLTS